MTIGEMICLPRDFRNKKEEKVFAHHGIWKMKDEEKVFVNIAVILSGGTGSRAGSCIPKQYVEVKGRPMICFCMETLFAHKKIDAVQIVADEAWRAYILPYVYRIGKRLGAQGKFRGFSAPGENRQLSIYHALTDIRKYAGKDDAVLVHDAARPFVKSRQIDRCFIDLKGHDGVLPVLPMKDTVYMADGERICSLLDRKRIYIGQAPELFLLEKYYEANRALLPDRILAVNGSTEPAVMAHMDICLSEGDEENYKVTTAGDLERFKRAIG